MNEEIQKWFTDHGKVISADTIEDKASVVPGASLIQYTFEDGAKLTIRAAKYGADGAQTAPQEIISRELPTPKAGSATQASNVYVGVNPSTGKPSQVSEYPDPSAPGGVRRTYDDTQVPAAALPAKATVGRVEGTPLPGGGFDNTKPIWVERDESGAQVGAAKPLTADQRTQWERERNPGGKSDAEIRAAAAAVPGPATLKPDGKGGTIAVQTRPDGTMQTTPLPGVPSEAIPTYTDVKQDPNTGAWSGLTSAGQWVPLAGGPGVAAPKPRQYEQDGRRYEEILNPDGSVKETREIPKPAGSGAPYTYPELKLAYGNISTELMAISRDIYSRVGVGEGKITKEEADRLFKPIYEQASLRISELNSLVSTQQSVWQQQLSTANQRLDASTRMAGQAFGLANQAHLMAPGTGKVAGQMVWDMMHAQKDFASGMGGLPDTGKLPGYLQAAMGMGPDTPTGAAPGLGVPAAPGLAPPPPVGAGAAPVAAPGGAAGLPSEAGHSVAGTSASPTSPPALPPPLLGPPPAVTGSVADPPTAPPAPPAGAPPGLGQGQDLSTPPAPGPIRVAPDIWDGTPSQLPGGPAGYLNPAAGAGGGITINIGGQPQSGGVAMGGGAPPAPGSLASADYLSPAQNPRRPSLQESQRQIAGGLLDVFPEDVLEEVWQRNTGQSLLGQRRMAGAGAGAGGGLG